MQHHRITDKEYTTSEIGIILVEMNNHIIEIKEQVRATNGRVKNLEMWRQFLLGAWAVLSIITPVVWYMVYNSIKDFKETITRQMSSVVEEAIQKNNDKYFQK